MVLSVNPIAPYPPELIDRVAEMAASDADLAGHCLRTLGLAPTDGTVRSLPGDFLIEFGAAMRLIAWEVGGLNPVEFGLPTARDAILQALQYATRRILHPGSPAPAPALAPAVFRVVVERLAWAGPRDLDAEILLEVPDEDVLIEAMARFLWARRGAARADEGGNSS
jgi:hypothetical protein